MRNMARWWVLAIVACSTPPTSTRAPAIAAPVAEQRPHVVEAPHGKRSDPYFWLRDDKRADKKVLAYLEAENAYARAVLEPARKLEDELVRESRARIDEDEKSVPTFEDGYWHYALYERGTQHPTYLREKDGKEEVLLDGNALAKGHAFYTIGAYATTRDGKLLAWTDDSVGREHYTLHVKDLTTGRVLADTATDLASSVVWANDNKTLFVVGRDPTTSREDRVIRHSIGGKDEIVFQEKDTSYYVDVGITKSRRYITIELDATTESETRIIDADQPTTSTARVFWPRKADHIYSIEHLGDRFVVRTNEDAENFQVIDAGKAGDRRTVIVPHRADVFVEDFAVYPNAIAVAVRSNGLRSVRVVPSKGQPFEIDAAPPFAMSVLDTPDPAGKLVRYSVESLVAPRTIYEIDPATRERKVVWQEKVPTYDASKYASEYLRVGDVRVPVSIVSRKGTPRDGTAPLLLLGYGAYGDTFEPEFDRERVSLLDRGWVIAIAHVRGGGELGQRWYDDGRLLAKKHSFEDFIAVAEHLVANKYAARDRLYTEGSSAGGLLVAATMAMRPELFRGVIAWVPFVDVVTTMLDESLPLVTNEYEEWGDPRDKAAYDYMLSYSPYDNVRAVAYPALYVRSGYWDGLVPYHEHAKWVAKLRANKTGDRPLLLETDLKAGHAGVSGRYDAVREEARAYAFLLQLAR